MSEGFSRLGLLGTAALLRSGEQKSVDFARLCIEQTQALDPLVHAWTTFNPDILMRHAAAADAGGAKGLLHGIPIGVKDIFNTRDYPTQMGSSLWAGFTPGNDARSVFHLLRAGGIVAGKTVTAEFAVHALGDTLNPYDPAITPGTSSSGSAAAVAAGMVPAALGTQTAGSIIRPASFCGVYGLKPSFGLIPRTGMLKTTDSLDTIGFFTAHAADLAVMLDVLRVHGADYPLINRAFGDSAGGLEPRTGPWRIALFRGPVWEHAEDYAREAVEQWLRRTGQGSAVEIVEIDFPESLARAHEIHATIYNASLAYYFKHESQKTDFVSPIMNEIIAAGRAISGADFRAALVAQEELAAEVDRLFADVDFVVSLSTAGSAPPRNTVERPDSALIWTLAHIPTLSAPAFSDAAGRPFGLQLASRRYGDARLLEFVAELVEQDLLPQRSPFPQRLARQPA